MSSKRIRCGPMESNGECDLILCSHHVFACFGQESFNLRAIKQDHMCEEIDMPAMSTTVNVARDWLSGMGQGAENHNFSIQYCMTVPLITMNSVRRALSSLATLAIATVSPVSLIRTGFHQAGNASATRGGLPCRGESRPMEHRQPGDLYPCRGTLPLQGHLPFQC